MRTETKQISALVALVLIELNTATKPEFIQSYETGKCFCAFEITIEDLQLRVYTPAMNVMEAQKIFEGLKASWKAQHEE